MERERTPHRLMELGIQLHLSGLSLSNTISELENLGVDRSRKAVHNWVQKTDLQPASGASPDHVVLNKAVIRINGQQFWLYAAVEPHSSGFLHVRLFTTTTTVLTQQFLREFREKHDVADTVFLVERAYHLAAALQRAGLRFRPVRYGNRNAIQHVFRGIKRRTISFSNSFSYVEPTTAETWLQAFAVWWNSLN